MEPHVSTEDEGEPKERKIHFAVPASVPTNLDPRQVEMIRRRRPTPATLFRVADQSSPEDDQSTHQVKWVVGENGVLKPKRVNPNVYQPPSLRDHQETPTTEQSGKFSSVRETARQIQAAQEEEEEEEDEEEEKEDVEEEEGDKIKGTTEKKSRGNY
ncbi:protein phosphatase 1 regulatory subunit 1B isoform X4 [Sander lucioperca]|uniref:protein phosphatase 1 regulatory subunit 1B isoform X4 n=1 Tax=Sander lucioperca TaxID=283035 RepID=UPI00125D111B|nr:protein phosphatase 1 regulatory subunit 1B isoform X4 [Sander lucioperca]